jgi:autophagy-related protein 2
MIDDDLPTNLDYLDESFGTAAGFMSDDELLGESTDEGEMSESMLESHASLQPAAHQPVHMSASSSQTTISDEDLRGRNGETIRMHEDIHIIEDYFETIEPDPLLSADVE